MQHKWVRDVLTLTSLPIHTACQRRWRCAGGSSSDVLNDTSTSYLELDIAYVSRIDHPGEILADYALSIVRKDRLSFVVIATGLEMALKQNQATYVYRRQWPVFITVPYFEITGQIEAPANIDLRALMTTGVERFIPVYNATASLIHQSIDQVQRRIDSDQQDLDRSACASATNPASNRDSNARYNEVGTSTVTSSIQVRERPARWQRS